jgi:hypothetical protein
MHSSEDDRIFDGAQFPVDNHDNHVWPTYIIRYASRRDLYAAANGSTTAAPGAPPVGVAPGGGDQPNATLGGVRERGSGL